MIDFIQHIGIAVWDQSYIEKKEIAKLNEKCAITSGPKISNDDEEIQQLDLERLELKQGATCDPAFERDENKVFTHLESNTANFNKVTHGKRISASIGFFEY